MSNLYLVFKSLMIHKKIVYLYFILFICIEYGFKCFQTLSLKYNIVLIPFSRFNKILNSYLWTSLF